MILNLGKDESIDRYQTSLIDYQSHRLVRYFGKSKIYGIVFSIEFENDS